MQSVETPQMLGIYIKTQGKSVTMFFLFSMMQFEKCVFTVRPVNSLRRGRMRPSHSVNSSSKHRSKRFRNFKLRSRLRMRSEIVKPAIPIRLRKPTSVSRISEECPHPYAVLDESYLQRE